MGPEDSGSFGRRRGGIPREVATNAAGKTMRITPAVGLLLVLLVLLRSPSSAGGAGVHGDPAGPSGGGSVGEEGEERGRSILNVEDPVLPVSFPRPEPQLRLPAIEGVRYVKLLPVGGDGRLLVALATWSVIPGAGRARELR